MKEWRQFFGDSIPYGRACRTCRLGLVRLGASWLRPQRISPVEGLPE